MTWKDDFLDGSFRGVAIKLREAKSSSGRRLALHQYPRIDKTEHEDLGLKDRVISIDGYVIGSNYNLDRDRLEEAFNLYGPGKLVHPYRGVINVVVDSYSISESHSRGGAAFFSAVFLIEPDQVTVKSISRSQAVSNSKDTLDENIDAWFEDSYSLDNKPVATVNDARMSIDSAFDVMGQAKKSSESAASFKRQLSDAKGNIILLSLQPAIIASNFRTLISFGVEETDEIMQGFTTKDFFREHKRMFESISTPFVSTSALVSTEEEYPANQVQNLMRYNIISSMSYLITQIDFESDIEAQNAQDDIFSYIDSVSSDSTIDGRVFISLRDIRSKVYNYIQEIIINLPKYYSYTVQQLTNTLRLAYTVYGDIAEASRIEKRNRIINPAFISAGTVLSLRVYEGE
jgi:prophage DNA circulation protein